MDMRELTREQTGTLIELMPDRPLAVRLTPGAKVGVAAGTVWLTQEGMLEDVVLTAGGEFVVPAKGMQVLGAVEGTALVRIADIHAQARALRRDALRQVGRGVVDFVSRRWKVLRERVSRAQPPRPVQRHCSSC